MLSGAHYHLNFLFSSNQVSVSKARAIIVLASDENADQVFLHSYLHVYILFKKRLIVYSLICSNMYFFQSDARALRVVLSLTGVKEGLTGHVVVEMSDLDNEPLVKLVGGEMIETVVAHDVIGRLMIQCALQPGLAQVSDTNSSITFSFSLLHCLTSLDVKTSQIFPGLSLKPLCISLLSLYLHFSCNYYLERHDWF